MYTIELSSASLCLLGMPNKIEEGYMRFNYPTPSEIEMLKRKFSLRYNIELDRIQYRIREVENDF